MATLTFFDAYMLAVAEAKHNLSTGQITVALVAAANAPSQSADGVYADLTSPVASTNISGGAAGLNITTTSSSQTAGVYKLVLADLTITASGGSVGPFRYVVIYNNSATNDELIGMYDYGSDYTVADGDSFTLDFDPTNGALTLSAAP